MALVGDDQHDLSDSPVKKHDSSEEEGQIVEDDEEINGLEESR